MQYHKPRMRKVRILATLGPASDTPEMIEKLFRSGADAFRVNMSHGEQADKAQLIANIRAALLHIKDTAEQFKTKDPWTVLMRYVSERIAPTLTPFVPPDALAPTG